MGSAMKSAIWSAPGKIFLLGEYAVLGGAPALLATVGPRFMLSTGSFEGSCSTSFHPDSPAGKLAPGRSWHWLDPYGGAGGFGASTAQALLVEAALGEPARPLEERWKRYRSHSSGSGADFVAQASGGVIEWQASPFRVVDRSNSLEKICIRVLQASQKAGRKVQTHAHLARVDAHRIRELAGLLAPVLASGISAFASGNAADFSGVLVRYAELLASQDLEDGGARLECHALQRVPGVMGVKGSGALLSDALVAVVDPVRLDLTAWNREVSRLGLIDRGEISKAEPGVAKS